MNRSVSTDLELDAGTYSVLMKITAKRWTDRSTPEQVIKKNCRDKQDKLIQIGLAYDLAHAKGQIKETEGEKQLRKEREEKKKAAEKIKWRKEFREQKFKLWQINVKQKAREKRHARRKEERHRKRTDAAKAAAVPEGSATGGAAHPESDVTPENLAGSAAPPKYDAAPDTAATNDSSNAEQEPTPASSLETKAQEPSSEAQEPKSEAAALPSPPAESISLEPTQDPTSEAPIETSSAHELSQNFHAALQAIPSVLINGSSAPAFDPAPPSTAAPPSIAGPPALDSDYDSDASFNSSIDTDLDFPSSPVISPADIAVPAAAENDDEYAEFENDPWNAVCVVGLRVYSKDTEMCVEVVRPKEDDESESPLDVDDVSKGASGEKVEDQVEELIKNQAQEKAKEKANE